MREFESDPEHPKTTRCCLCGFREIWRDSKKLVWYELAGHILCAPCYKKHYRRMEIYEEMRRARDEGK